MLRASATATGRTVNLAAVIDSSFDPGLDWGRALVAFTDAAVLSDPEAMDYARRQLLAEGGEPAVVRAAACAGNFQMMNRLLDATGVPVTAAQLELAAELGLSVPVHLHPTRDGD